MSYKIVFCGTPDFAVPSLKALLADSEFEVDLVLTQPDRPAGRGKKLKASPIKTLALVNGIEVGTPEKLTGSEWQEKVMAGNYDLGVVVAYGQILSQDFLDSFKFGCVNVHSSLLPRWRGAAPMQRAIMAGDKETGVSLQKVVKKLDAGDVIAEIKIPLPLDLGARDLYQRLSHLGGDLLIHDLKKFLKGDITPRVQDDASVTHAAKILKEEATVDWNKSAFEIHNKIRGLDMGGPYAMTTHKGKMLKLHESQILETTALGEPGEVVEVNKNSFVISCGENNLELLIVQPESKSKMSSGDFIRGSRLEKGEKLG